MVGTKDPTEEVEMAVRKPWSTFPRGRIVMSTRRRTNPSSLATSRESSCTEKSFLKQSTSRKRSSQSLSRVPEHFVRSMMIVLGAAASGAINHDERDKHVLSLANYFASPVSDNAKLKRLRILVSLVTPKEASWQLLDSILRDTLRFLNDRSFDWPHHQHSAHVLLLELRAMCLYEIERQSLVVKSGQVLAGCIFSAARSVEYGLASSVPMIHCALDLAGNQVKLRMTPAVPTRLNRREQIVARTFTDTAKRMTENLRETAKWTAHSVRDASTERIHKVALRFEQERLGERLIPHEGSRNVLLAVGTVGIATLGAAAIVGEAMVATTASVVLKSADVAADVVRYKYGEHAGRVVEDTTHTTGNIARTIAHVTMLEASVLAKAVAKNTIRERAKRTLEGDEETDVSTTTDGVDLLTALKAGSFESRRFTSDSQSLRAATGVSKAPLVTIESKQKV